jgi:cell division protease FtsH
MRKFFKGATFYILLFLVIFLIVQFAGGGNQQEIKDLTTTELITNIENKTILQMEILENNVVQGKLTDGTVFTTHVPGMIEEPFGSELYTVIKDSGLSLNSEPPMPTPWFVDILPTIFLVLLLVVFWFVFMQNSQGGGSKVMSFGKSKARMIKDDDGKKIAFADVAGLKEEKEELWEIVDFLKSPKRYIDLGARIPKGILMVGPPGTGKTYLSKAIAGEAGVPFFSISGSDFVEMFVGVGASRVRDLFENAKKNAPCIIFIDEIDAVGRKRGAGLGGGHDEREQTLNQLLVEMDGFSDNEGIIMIAATNRPDILDPALLRPGRFDREITVGRPDVREREEIIAVHAKNKPLADDVDFKILAKSTPGFTPADIENLMNESALLAARKKDTKIHMDTIREATTKVIAGVEKKSRVVSEKERRLTAYHEGGHALLAKVLPDMDPVHQVTIIPRGRAGGFTMQLPQEDRNYRTKKQMENELIVLLGGRVAEKLILQDISTGASNDLERVSAIARSMVTKFAMSENLSSMSYSSEDEVFLGRDMTTRRNYSEQVAAEIDREVRRIVDNAYEKAEQLLTDHIDKLHTIAESLLEYETLEADEFNLCFTDGLDALREKVERDEEKRKAERAKAKEQAEAEKLAFEALINAKSELEKNKAENQSAEMPEVPAEESVEASNDENTQA